MPTYLFGWNPARWEWKYLDEQIRRVARIGYADYDWSCGNTKSVPTGSAFFLIRLGKAPKGIVGSGVTRSEPGVGRHWDRAEASMGKESLNVDIRFDFLSRTPLVTWDELLEPPFNTFRWGIQASGVRLPSPVAEALISLWRGRVEGDVPSLADEVSATAQYPEGSKKTVMVNAYERNPQARAACVAHYGFRCSVCNELLEERYGRIAVDFIHVHHIVPLSSVGPGYQVDPTRDLRPVCPNCHAIIHLARPPLTIEQARKLVDSANRDE